MSNPVKLLVGHISPETAYLVSDYPYGYTLRCKIRYWLDYRPGKGVRFVSQTTNPKRPGEVWNKPKASTYCKFGGAMYLDENNHVHWRGLTEYCTAQEAQAYLNTYGDAVPEACKPLLRKWVAGKVAYEANRTKDDPLTKGLIEAHKAMRDTE